MTDNTIPQNVIEALAEARATGATNMFNRSGVIEIVDMIDEDAGAWLSENKSRYMDALNAMGEYISKPKAAPVNEGAASLKDFDEITPADYAAVEAMGETQENVFGDDSDDNSPLATLADDLLADMKMMTPERRAAINNPVTIAAGFETEHRNADKVVRVDKPITLACNDLAWRQMVSHAWKLQLMHGEIVTTPIKGADLQAGQVVADSTHTLYRLLEPLNVGVLGWSGKVYRQWRVESVNTPRSSVSLKPFFVGQEYRLFEEAKG